MSGADPEGGTAAFLAFSVFTHLLWGWYAPCARYVETLADRPLNPGALMCAVMVLSSLANNVQGVCARAYEARRRWSRRPLRSQYEQFDDGRGAEAAGVQVVLGKSTGAGEANSGNVDARAATGDSLDVEIVQEQGLVAHGGSGTASVAGPPKAGEEQQQEVAEASVDAKQALEEADKRRMTLRKFGIGVGYGCMMLARAVTNVASALYTYAYYIQATALLNPFVTAVLARLMLGEKKLPPLFCVAFLGSAFGALLAIYGEHSAKDSAVISQGPSGHVHAPTLMDTFVGIGLQLISVCLSSMNRIAIKLTQQENIATDQLAAFQFGTGTLLLGLYVTVTDPQQWVALFSLVRMGGFAMGVLLFFSLAVYFAGTTLQMVVIRAIGPVIHSSFQPVRMITALVGTYWLMREPVRSPLTWVGLLVMIGALSLYFRAQLKKPS